MTTTTKQRNSSFELLRIIAMIFIILHHFSVHGGFNFSPSDLSLNRFWIDFISMFGKVGVDLFVLISGYFLISKDGPLIDIKRILKIWIPMIIYGIIIYLLFVTFDNQPITFISLYNRFIPTLSGHWWFASTYIVLFLLHPFLNALLRRIDQKTYKILILLMITIWSIIPTFLNKSLEGNNLTWFITLYAIAGYIRLYGLNPKIKRSHYLISFITLSLITILLTIMFACCGKYTHELYNYTTYLFRQNMLTILLISISLFMFFVNTNIKTNKIINLVSSTTFGIYLIHDDGLVRSFIWHRLFKNFKYQSSLWLIPYSISVSLLVFVVCCIIDLIRIKFLEKYYMKFVNKHGDKLLYPFKWLYLKISDFIFGK